MVVSIQSKLSILWQTSYLELGFATNILYVIFENF